MKTLELLAPARNLEYGLAAINYGADAVYIGAPRFGARSAAGNSVTDIEKLVAYAHKFRAKVYVALNTLLFDSELNDAEEIISQVWNAGVDALIFQDMGILELNLPPIPLFASTQTHNSNWQKVKFLESVGIQRVILARELSLNEISEIRSYTAVELESFVHGAICVCYSGQCYLSQHLTGKSGNRGECIQACRWEYSLKNQAGITLINNEPLLSPKDLNLGNYLEELIQSGVTSFKIEGRLKDIAYLKNVTSLYRTKLDQIIEDQTNNFERSSLGFSKHNFTPDPEKTFNRGYTSYFIKERQKGIASGATQKSIGKAIGKVIETTEKSVIINTKEPIANGDGFCYFDLENHLQGFRVNRVVSNILYLNEPISIKSGTMLYRNHDQQFEKMLENFSIQRKLLIDFKLSETSTGIRLAAEYAGNEAETEIILEKQNANQPQKALDTIIQSLSKCGNTIFEVRNIQVKLEPMLFVPNSALNDLRRTCLQLLDNILVKTYSRNEFSIIKNSIPYYEKELNFEANILNKKSEAFYIRHGCKINEWGFELHKSKSFKKLMTTRYCIKYEMAQCPKYHNQTDSNWQSELQIENSKGKFKLQFNCKKCEMEVIAID